MHFGPHVNHGNVESGIPFASRFAAQSNHMRRSQLSDDNAFTHTSQVQPNQPVTLELPGGNILSSAVLRAADEQGLKADHTAYKLIEGWLARNPGPQLVAAWRGYVTALRANLTPAAYAAMRADILERTRKIMRAAGGYLGFAHSTAQEKELLAKMEEILG